MDKLAAELKAEIERQKAVEAEAKAQVDAQNLKFKFYTKWAVGNLETLENNQVVSGVTAVAGFLATRWEDMIPYAVIVDGKVYKYFNSQNKVSRRDVEIRFPEYRLPKESGFSMDVDWSGFEAGEHIVEVVLETWDGNVTMRRNVIVQ